LSSHIFILHADVKILLFGVVVKTSHIHFHRQFQGFGLNKVSVVVGKDKERAENGRRGATANKRGRVNVAVTHNNGNSN